jgi:hypothetical protein
MTKYRQRLTTFTFHDFTQKSAKRAQGVGGGGQFCTSGGPTGGPGRPNGPQVYMLKYALVVLVVAVMLALIAESLVGNHTRLKAGFGWK